MACGTAALGPAHLLSALYSLLWCCSTVVLVLDLLYY